MLGQNSPHGLADLKVGRSKVLVLEPVPFVVALLLHQALVPLAARIGRLARKVFGNGTPVETLLAERCQSRIVLGSPCGRGTFMVGLAHHRVGLGR